VYNGQVHTITFGQASYIMDDGPSLPADTDAWQHWLWSARQTQQDAFATLEADRARISHSLYGDLAARFATYDALAFDKTCHCPYNVSRVKC
jgi:hypothetical protein